MLIKQTREGLGEIQQPIDKVEKPEPTVLEGFGAALFSTDHSIVNAVDYFDDDIFKVGSMTVDPNYDLSSEIEGTHYEDFAIELAEANNTEQLNILKNQLDEKLQANDTLERLGGVGYAIELTTGLFDPVNLIPISAGANAAAKGKSLLSIVGRSAGAGAGLSAANEVLLQGTQGVRTLEESAYNIAGGTLLSTILGTGAGALARRANTFDGLAKKLEQDMIIEDSVGAARTPETTIEQETLQSAAGFESISSGFNPVMRLATSPSKQSRKIAEGLIESPLFKNKNLDGIATDQAVETFRKEHFGRFFKAQESRKFLYKDYLTRTKGEEGRLPVDKFNESISMAMRRNDTSDIPEVQKAAQFYRKEVFTPLKEMAIENKLLPKDVTVKTAESYLMRMWDSQKIVQNENQFRRVVSDWVRKETAKVVGNRDVDFTNKVIKLEEDLARARSKDNQVEIKKVQDDIAKLTRDKGQEDSIIYDVDNNFDDYVSRTVDDIVTTLKGGDTTSPAYDVTVRKRGPLKERVFNIPDNLVEDFLVNDIEQLASRYTQVMGTDVELKSKFGSLDLKKQIQDIRDEYSELAKRIDDSTKDAAKQRRKLDKQMQSDIRDIEAMRDIMRGVTGKYNPDPSSGWVRTSRQILLLNYMAKMGGVTLSSFPDIARATMVHGFNRAFGKLLTPMITRSKGFKMSKAEARTAAIGYEHISNGRLATLAEIGNQYRHNTAFERMTDNIGAVFTKATLMPYWNNLVKEVNASITMNRVLGNVRSLASKGALDASETRYMAYLGIDSNNVNGIAKMLKKHGDEVDGYLIANSEKWEDGLAAKTFRAAVAKDVDRTIVSKSIGDVPLFMHSQTGKLIMQFRSFALAAHQRVFLSAMQQRDKAIVNGVIYSVISGMITYALKSYERGVELSDDPAKWIVEGFDRSGLAPILMEVNNMAEKVGAPGIGRLTGQAPASRFASRNISGALGGPTVGVVQDVGVSLNAIFQGNVDEGAIKAMRRLAPFQNLIGVRTALDKVME